MRLTIGGVIVNILRIVLTVIFVIDCIGLTVVVLMQEGKQKGLGAISGMADTYWGQKEDPGIYSGRYRRWTEHPYS